MNKLYLLFALLSFGFCKAQCSGAEPGPNPGDTGCFTVTNNGATIEYATVRAADGQIWLQQNLGSAHVATSATDGDSYGDYYQWGRWADGHQIKTSATATTLPTPNNPTGLGEGNANFYTSASGSAPKWWTDSPAVTDTWTATTPAQTTATNGCDPCRLLGEGWHLPSHAEWLAIIAGEQITDIATAFESNLKLTVAGNRTPSGGMNFEGLRGYYWSSTVSPTNASNSKYLYYSNAIVNAGAGGYRDQGSSIRCLKAATVVVPDPTSLAITTLNNIPTTITTNAGTLQLVATVLPATANQNVTWSITTGNMFATISASGLVTATANGTVTIQAVSVEDTTVLDTIDVVITGQVTPVASLTITTQNNIPATITTNEGTLQLVATVLPAAANQNVTWSITTGSTFATISESGLVTAMANGTVTIQAVSVEDATVLDTIDVVITGQVTPAEGLVISTLNSVPAVINTLNGTLQLQAAVLPAQANQAVTWSITAGSTFATISASGLVTATANGTAIIQAVSVEDATILDTIDIVITGQDTAGLTDAATTAFTIYPNPVTDVLTITTAATVKQVTVYTTDGRTVTTANATQVNFSNLATGLYIVRIQFDNGAEAIQKVIKK